MDGLTKVHFCTMGELSFQSKFFPGKRFVSHDHLISIWWCMLYKRFAFVQSKERDAKNVPERCRRLQIWLVLQALNLSHPLQYFSLKASRNARYGAFAVLILPDLLMKMPFSIVENWANSH